MGSKKGIESLSNFEWQIMNQIWEMGSSSAREVLEALTEEHRRAYTTIQTYLERLVDKKFLSKEKVGLVNFYRSLIPRDRVVRKETKRFVDQIFGGSSSQLAAYLLDEGEISQSDLDRIKKMLEDSNE